MKNAEVKVVFYNVFPFLFLLLFAGCSSRTTSASKEQQKALYDSLETRCYDRVTQTDSLRLEAENFMRQTQAGTPEYFRARQFYINSYFNEKKFDRVLEMLYETEQMPGYKDLPGTQADYLYTRSRCYQFTQQYDKAIDISRRIMDLVPAPGDTLAHESIRTRAVGAMNNVNNIFYFTNRPSEGADWFHRLRSNPPALLYECCRRDMMIFEGYLAGLAGQSKRAEAVMDSAWATPIYRKTAENTFRDCAFSASVYYSLPHRQEERENLLKYAISEGRKDKNVPGINWAMNMLGTIYKEQNRFQEAVQLQYQGLEIGLRQQDSAFCANCFFVLSQIYYKWKAYPQARYYINKAATWDKNKHVTNDDRGNHYLMKYAVADKLPGYKREERLKLLATADSCYRLASRSNPITYVYRAREWLMHPPFDAKKGLLELEKHNEQKTSSKLNDLVKTIQMIGLIRAGREAEARRILSDIKEYPTKEYYDYLDTLMSHYIRQGDNLAIAHLTKFREPILKDYQEQAVREAVMSADVKYRTKEKEQENRLLAAEVKIKNSRLQLSIVIGLCLFTIGLCTGGWFWIRQKALKFHLHLEKKEKETAENRLREQADRLKQLIASRQELNNHNEELLRQLAEVQSAHEKTCDLDRVMESLQPRLLTSEEEQQFRSAFSSLHPTVLHQLRSICPRATRTDELMCMLIVLKQTNEEIARTLGISRSSVLQNRYRLRTKLNLLEGSDLDTEVCRLLVN